MTYTVKEIFKTLQGEGAHSGRVAVFCRFSGCNLWSGREQDRTRAICKFCDTEFVGGDKYVTAADLADAVNREWGETTRHKMVVITGGEPALQYDDRLFRALLERGFYVAIETNGTVPLQAHAHWICISPKAGTEICLVEADEIKVVFPQDMNLDEIKVCSPRYSLQPMDGPDREKNTQAAIEYCLTHPQWRLSLQTHKFAGIR